LTDLADFLLLLFLLLLLLLFLAALPTALATSLSENPLLFTLASVLFLLLRKFWKKLTLCLTFDGACASPFVSIESLVLVNSLHLGAISSAEVKLIVGTRVMLALVREEDSMLSIVKE